MGASINIGNESQSLCGTHDGGFQKEEEEETKIGTATTKTAAISETTESTIGTQ